MLKILIANSPPAKVSSSVAVTFGVKGKGNLNVTVPETDVSAVFPFYTCLPLCTDLNIAVFPAKSPDVLIKPDLPPINKAIANRPRGPGKPRVTFGL